MHVIVLYLLGLLCYQNIMRIQCSAGDSVKSGGGGVRAFLKFQGGLRNFQDPGDEDSWGVGWAMSDNDIFQRDPKDTIPTIL